MRMSGHTTKPALGPIGTKVLLENDHIRVWSIELPPNGHQPLHEHHHPYLIVPITKGKSVMKWPDGRERELTDVPGDVKFREPTGGPHELFNLENDNFHCVLVEVKVPGKPG
jgi:beta-alanine degradation protein BauB